MGTCAAQQSPTCSWDAWKKFFFPRLPKPLSRDHGNVLYIDDIHFLWTHGEEDLQEFQSYMINFHPTIRYLPLNFLLPRYHSWTPSLNSKTIELRPCFIASLQTNIPTSYLPPVIPLTPLKEFHTARRWGSAAYVLNQRKKKSIWITSNSTFYNAIPWTASRNPDYQSETAR